MHGFTMVELITVMVLLGVLAAIAIPRLMGDNVVETALYGDKVASALRLAQKTAVAKRRIVCLDTASGTLRVSRQAAGDASCGVKLKDVPDGLFGERPDGVTLQGAPAQLHFMPDGSIRDGSGAQAGDQRFSIRLSGKAQRTIRVDGGTGYVD